MELGTNKNKFDGTWTNITTLIGLGTKYKTKQQRLGLGTRQSSWNKIGGTWTEQNKPKQDLEENNTKLMEHGQN